MQKVAIALFFAGAALACGSKKGGSGFDTASSSGGASSGGSSGASGGGPTFGDGGTPQTGGADCTEENKQIYAVSQEGSLYRYAPATNTITPIGPINCHGKAKPFSMAVDRKGIGWVLFDDDNVYLVNTTNAACQPSPYKPNGSPFTRFGMAFMSDSAGSTSETLYVADYDGTGIAKIDTSTGVMSRIGDYDGFASSAELTGTGDARLYGFFLPKDPITYPRIVKLDNTNAKMVDSHDLAGTDIGSGWAFAFWGGDFWLFTAPNGSSEIDQYQWSAGATNTVKQDLGYVIVGAGVSTCAPTAPPK